MSRPILQIPTCISAAFVFLVDCPIGGSLRIVMAQQMLDATADYKDLCLCPGKMNGERTDQRQGKAKIIRCSSFVAPEQAHLMSRDQA